MQILNLDGYTFTAYNDSRIDRIIASQIQEISKEVLAHTRNGISLFLLRGYARGEGASFFRPRESSLSVTTTFFSSLDTPMSLRFLQLDQLRRKFHVQYHIEVGHDWKFRLPFVAKRIYYYEAKFGSNAAYGDQSVLKAIPIHTSADTDPKEGHRLMFKRPMGMLRVSIRPS